jgi:hypothetical protein
MKVVADGIALSEFEPVAIESTIPLPEHAGEDAISPDYRYRRRAETVLDRGGYVIVITTPDRGVNYDLSIKHRYGT